MTRTDRRDHRQLIDEAQQLGPALARLADTAQRDPAVFCQSVLRTEDTNDPVRLAPIHEEWHDILTEHDNALVSPHFFMQGVTQGVTQADLWHESSP